MELSQTELGVMMGTTANCTYIGSFLWLWCIGSRILHCLALWFMHHTSWVVQHNVVQFAVPGSVKVFGLGLIPPIMHGHKSIFSLMCDYLIIQTVCLNKLAYKRGVAQPNSTWCWQNELVLIKAKVITNRQRLTALYLLCMRAVKSIKGIWRQWKHSI